ncbi:MAG: AbrB/MazE/SpoVT family DNA-binding domain-containing protein [Nitrospirae bacterium]|nr:AbrB/MazE/SpoVT family DNA-binding domain-containing protein [Nitrospirota bacterium]
MKATIVPIGNSKGIRIPKIILEQCRIEKEVDLEVEDDNIIIKPFKKEPRKDWEDNFRKMEEEKEDRLIIDDQIDLDMKGWEW